MIGDTVAIEIPEAVSEQDEGRTIGACEAALGDDRCGRVDQGFPGDFTARVTHSGSSEITIELTLAGQDEVATLRVLKFAEEEPEAFRWQSVGVVVGALVLSQTPAETSPSEDAEPARTKPKPEPPDEPNVVPPSADRPNDSKVALPVTEPNSVDIVTIDLAPLVASTASGAGVAGGAWLAAAIRLKGPLHVVASGDASFSAANDSAADLRASALGATLGLGLRAPLGDSSLGWELSARGALQRLNLHADSGTEAGAAGTLRWGGRGGAALYWLPSRFWGLVIGGDAGLLWPPIEVDVAASSPTRISALVWGGYLGLRIRLNRM